mmetsp:Transcript_42901/g.100705  ORF Transcript_42901/g.100705 Transcript_42901/m.100705 type:complete len:94 (-) Transcript_42901:2014-2295(-)
MFVAALYVKCQRLHLILQLDLLPQLFIFLGVALSLLDHSVNLLLRQAFACIGDAALGIGTCFLVTRCDIQYSVGIEGKCHFDLRLMSLGPLYA